ncbi:2-dehydro-3-deoxygalactonokinase [Roseateles oligotrophus]|uniref:2-dehydro-3-deoxygalactonokinase n=1 Tax=Roseateles oligotrophus TaxID=1769250 RepID=A0ABT2YI48_9BURK|nr:2-dehydro-3-deoxygalactonokinase [Roseateles oligotrophus]MCV2369661.1 2-dehydro-3-deoxygalactonokinase [Roseateles oligotrophus]
MSQAPMESAALLALDWGSSGLRAFLLDGQGLTLASRSSAMGASVMDGRALAYVQALQQIAGDWLQANPRLPLLACGMVGAKHGWREAPYAACPANEAALAAQTVSVEFGQGRSLRILPGLLQQAAGQPPDVMRGEETQVFGALQQHPQLADAACIVMPGTHSKWAELRDSQLRGFATHMTGELFALLRQHSVLGRLMPPVDVASDSSAFLAGLRAAREQGELGLSHQLFAVRTLGLTGELAAAALADYMSGLLIGHELRAGLAWRDRRGLAQAPLLLIGEPGLCARYAQGLRAFDCAADLTLDNTAPAGLWRLAQSAGWLRLPP